MRCIALCASIIAASLAQAQTNYLVTPRFKGGDRTTYVVRTKVVAGPITIEATGNATDTVLEFSEKILVERVLRDVKIKQNGSEQTVSDVSSTRIEFSRNGQLLQIFKDNKPKDQMRQDSMVQFICPDTPIHAGSRWRVPLNKDDAAGVRKMEITYEVLGFENLKGDVCAKVSVKATELEGKQPMSSVGTMWISTTNGRAFKSTFDITNSPMVGGDAKVTLEQEIK